MHVLQLMRLTGFGRFGYGLGLQFGARCPIWRGFVVGEALSSGAHGPPDLGSGQLIQTRFLPTLICRQV